MLGRTFMTCQAYSAATSFSSGTYHDIVRKSNSHYTALLLPSLTASVVSRHSCTMSNPAMISCQDQPSLATVAVAQMTSVGCQETNFATCRRLALEAMELGCCMRFLPEGCSFIGRNQREAGNPTSPHVLSDAILSLLIQNPGCNPHLSLLQTVAAGQPVDGSAMARFRDLAKSANIWLSLGGFQESGPDSEHIYNTHVVLNGQGQIVASYRKASISEPNAHVMQTACMVTQSLSSGHSSTGDKACKGCRRMLAGASVQCRGPQWSSAHGGQEHSSRHRGVHVHPVCHNTVRGVLNIQLRLA